MVRKIFKGSVLIGVLVSTLMASPNYKVYQYDKGTNSETGVVDGSLKVETPISYFVDVVRDGYLVGKGNVPTREESERINTAQKNKNIDKYSLVDGYEARLRFSDGSYGYIVTTEKINDGVALLVRRYTNTRRVQALILNQKDQELKK